MKFKSQWITTKDFAELKPLCVYHKELEQADIKKSEICNYHTYFKKKITITDFGSVTIKISADDYYKLYINGSFVMQGPAPAYPEHYNYNERDITRFLHKGENIITVHVYYQGCINRVWNSGDNRQGMIADIFADGKYIGGSDETWHYTNPQEFSGKTTGYDTLYLENIDFNLKDSDWKNSCSDEYENAVAINADYRFNAAPAECVDVYVIRPERCVKINDTDYFIDFGKEITGQFFMVACGAKNQKVTILCGEELDGENTARYKMRCGCEMKEVCTLSGGRDEFEFFDYKAFRYVNIKTGLDNLSPDTFAAVVRHHKFRERCTLKTNNKHLRDIWDMCVHTLRIGVQEGFLDCPTREKGQYLGDFTVSGLAYLYLTGDGEVYRKTLRDFAATASICKGLMSVAPGSIMQEIADFSLQYPLQLLNYYRVTGDKETLAELYPTVKNLIEYFSAFERSDGLLENANEKWNLVDWPANLRDGYDVNGEDRKNTAPCHNVINAFYVSALQCFEEISEILSIEAEKRADRVKKAYLDAFYDEEKKIFYDTEQRFHSALHSNVLAVYSGIAPECAYESVKNIIREKGLCCGTQFSYFVLKALSKMGAYDDELALITNETSHSWVNMLREGATTCFEAWGREQKWNTSLCHPWSCSPIIAIAEDIAEKSISENDMMVYEVIA